MSCALSVITRLLLTFSLLLPGLALAHGVQHHVQPVQATMVTLTYDNGQPFANAVFEAAPVEAAKAHLTGLTDAHGRALILTEPPGRWRLRAFSDDGHGAVLEFEVGPATFDADAPATAGSRWGRRIAGLLIVLAILAVIQWRVSKRADRRA